MSLKEQINKNKLPSHIAIIMDGNGRWAKQQGLLRAIGHENGTKSVRQTVEASAELGIKNLNTLCLFYRKLEQTKIRSANLNETFSKVLKERNKDTSR